MSQAQSTSPSTTIEDLLSAINSILRIFSTAIIYIFHCNGVYKVSNISLLFYAFSFFLFLSGYYSVIVRHTPKQWIFRRLRKIYIPYWIVISIVIIANAVFHYKKASALDIFFLIIGGNLFIPNPLYVIAWFISVIIITYLYVYIIYTVQNIVLAVLVTIGTVALLTHFHTPYYFFMAFAIGFLIHFVAIWSGFSAKVIITSRSINSVFSKTLKPLLYIQNHTYYFFLIHGGVILFFRFVLHADYYTTMIFGSIMSMFFSVPLCTISNKLDRKIGLHFATQTDRE